MNDVMFKQRAFQIAEANVTGTGQTVSFNDQPELRNDTDQKIIIEAIELITLPVLSKSTVNNATANAPITELPKATLLLYDDGWNKVYQMPLLLLNHMASDPAAFIPYTRDVRVFDDFKKVVWNKSQIVFVAAPAPTYAIILGVSYTRIKLK